MPQTALEFIPISPYSRTFVCTEPGWCQAGVRFFYGSRQLPLSPRVSLLSWIPLSTYTYKNSARPHSLLFTFSVFQYHPVIGQLIAVSCWQDHYLLCKICVVGVRELRNVGQKYGYHSEPYNWPNKQRLYFFKFERFWRWYMIIDATVILHIVHHSRVKTTTFRRLNLLPSSCVAGKRESLLWLIHRRSYFQYISPWGREQIHSP